MTAIPFVLIFSLLCCLFISPLLADEMPAPSTKAGKGPPATPLPTPAKKRTTNPNALTRLLTVDFLMNSNDVSSPMDNSEFLPVTGKNTGRSPSTKKLDGIFTFSNINFLRYKFSSIWTDDSGTGGLPVPFDTPIRELIPNFSAQYVQQDKYLFPVPAGWVNIGFPTSPQHSWEFIFSPGECWHEDADAQYDRCALNVRLVEGQQNAGYDLLITFVIHEGTLQPSQAWIQSMQTEAGYYQWNSWGFADVSFSPSPKGSVQDVLKTQVVSNFENLIASWVPTLPIEQIPGWQSAWTRTNNPMYNYTEHGQCSPVGWGYNYLFTFYGVLHYDGNLYAGQTSTQVGEHPYPEWVVYAGYSWTKSLWSGLAASMDLQHGCNYPSTPTSADNNKCIFDLLISDWVEGADATWSATTIKNCMDQATNHFNSSSYGVDEGNLVTNEKLFYTYPQSEKLAFALGGTNHHPEVSNGANFNYHTSTYVVLARALQRISSQVLGQEISEVYRQNFCIPLKLSDMHCNFRVTEDVAAQPFGGYGTYFYRDDMAKIGKFWAFSGGKVENRQIISTDYYKATMQLDSSNPGIPTLRQGDPLSTCYPNSSRFVAIPGQRYQNGWWSDQSTGPGYANRLTGCSNPRTVFMSGYSGQRMNVIPGVLGEYGGVYFQKGDNYDFDTTGALAFMMQYSVGCPKYMNL